MRASVVRSRSARRISWQLCRRLPRDSAEALSHLPTTSGTSNRSCSVSVEPSADGGRKRGADSSSSLHDADDSAKLAGSFDGAKRARVDNSSSTSSSSSSSAHAERKADGGDKAPKEKRKKDKQALTKEPVNPLREAQRLRDLEKVIKPGSASITAEGEKAAKAKAAQSSTFSSLFLPKDHVQEKPNFCAARFMSPSASLL